MATTSSTWRLDAPGALVGAGIDAEMPGRFRKWSARTRNPLPLVYSPAEFAHCRALRSPANGLCAAFCCKEALFKALGKPYDYRECTFLWPGKTGDFHLALSDGLRRQYRISSARVAVRYSDRARQEMVVAVYVFSDEGVVARSR